MNTSKSLDSILNTLFNAGIVYGQTGKATTDPDQAKQSIVEAVEGLIPQKYTGLMPKEGRLDPRMREMWDSYYRFYGFNMAIDKFLQAIKEWQ